MTKLMKDVFELPLKSVDYQNQIQDANGVEVPLIDFLEYEKKAICDAVNNHDTLTEQNKQLVEALTDISNMCIGEIAMGYKLDAQSIGEIIYKATGKTNPELNEVVAKYKEQI